MNKRPLAPAPLNKLDRNLLLNRPDTWSMRLHLVLYYALLFGLAVAFLTYFIPNDPRDRSQAPYWSVGIGLLSLMGFIVWLIYLFRFNVFKQYGKVFAGDRLKTFLSYYLIVACLVVVIYIPPVIESVRANQQYSSEELAADMNRINELITRLEYDNIPDQWIPDTLVVDNNNQYSHIRPHFSYVDTTQLRWQLESADSVEKINNRMYVSWSFFNLAFVNDSRIGEHSEVPVLRTKDLYTIVYRNHRPVDERQATKALGILLEKYRGETDEDWGDYYVNDLNSNIHQRYNLYRVNNSFDHIADRKYRMEHRDMDEFIRASHYVVLVLALFVFIFRHTTIRTFFLSLLTLVVLSILTGLLVALFNLREPGLLIMMLLYFLALFVLAITAYASRVRSVFKGIALNLVVLSTPFLPLMVVGLYYSVLRRYYYDHYDYYEWYPNKDLHILLAEIGGVVILLVLVETLYKRLYRSWYAAPEE
jgi:hypothetical protein